MFDKIHYFEARTINYDSDKFLSIIRDITDRKDAEKIITHQNDELLKLNVDKDRFISILAHDLRSPFNAILGFTDLLLSNIRTYTIDETIELLSIVKSSSNHTFNLLNELLTWARSQSGKMPFEPQEILFIDLYDEVIDNIQIVAHAKNIMIDRYSDSKLTVFADNNMLHTILRNLISNAIKFSYIGSKISIYAIKKESEIEITVSDLGVGIDLETISKLFNISEVHTTRGTNEEKGTGLGLLLCKEFIEQHGGRIWVESEVGRGSNFIFTIPQKK
jgi:signal transduction histidine kinase